MKALTVVAALGASLAASTAARAQALVADVTAHLVAVTTGFTGAELTVFGAIEDGRGGDVVVSVRGPEGTMIVRRKEQVFGLWLNRSRAIFDRAPLYYGVATSRPLREVASSETLARAQIGADAQRMIPRDEMSGVEADVWRRELIALKHADGRYPVEPARVIFLGSRLFRASVALPADTPIGPYTVSVFLFRDGQVAAVQTTPLIVSQIGVAAELHDVAHRQAPLYAAVSLALAVGLGWLGGVLFRRS